MVRGVGKGSDARRAQGSESAGVSVDTPERADARPTQQPTLSRRPGAQVAQSAEHVLGKDEVGGSIPLLGFRVAH